MVSGSLETGVGVIKTAAASEGTNGACGSFYPDLGVILLNPLKMNSIASLTAGSSSDAFDDNGKKLFQKEQNL